jgi:hypothetical protein
LSPKSKKRSFSNFFSRALRSSRFHEFLSFNSYSLPVYFDSYLPNPSFVNLNDFALFNTEGTFDFLEDSYESLKNVSFVYFYNSSNFLNFSSSSFSLPFSYMTVLDSFRQSFNDNNILSPILNYPYHSNNLCFTPNFKYLNFTNNVKLSSTAKNSTVTFNAVQKVYKSRFDDSRSNVNFSFFHNSSLPFPFLVDSKTNYSSILNKNKETFFTTNFYKPSFIAKHSFFQELYSLNNFIFLDLPFLLSLKSDASRYL